MSKRKARTIRWSASAMRDLDQIAAYIARDNPQAARRWIDRLRKTAEGAARMPLAARIVPEIQRDDVREVFLGSYRIVYGVRDDHIFVFTVFGGGKQLSEDAVPRG
jgi:addiction module RelE/StbE family toxin